MSRREPSAKRPSAVNRFKIEKMSKTFIVEVSKTGRNRSIRKSSLAVKDSKYAVEKVSTKVRKKAAPPSDKEQYVFHADSDSGKSAWDEAHELMEHFFQEGKEIDFVEPETEHLLFDPKSLPKSRMAGASTFLQNWPKSSKTHDHAHPHAWHLNDEHSQLKKARELAAPYFEKGRRVKIAHFDTGYDPEHPFLPRHLNKKQGRSFVDGDEIKDATDVEKGTSMEQQWHGAATMAILAGGHVESFDGKTEFNTDFGGAPLAEIVPIRLADGVALIKTSAFAKALDYATDIGCEVVTMSMAGVPSIKWARAVNRAYEAGVTIVSAAGNSWVKGPKKFLPKCLLYPARWERVIAACGVTCNDFPYVFEANPFKRPKKQDGFGHTEYMQGNYGPSSLMKYSLAAYTPNLPWASKTGKNEKRKWFSLSGGGTSSATPQIAAAAALWIQRFRAELDSAGISGTWKQVEAVRHGLFQSAQLGDYEEAEKYFGNGCLKAADALQPKFFPKESDLVIAPKAKVFMPLLKVFFGGRRGMPTHPGMMDMYATELIQLAHHNPELQVLLTTDLTEQDVIERKNIPDMDTFLALRSALVEAGASKHLLNYMGIRV